MIIEARFTLKVTKKQVTDLLAFAEDLGDPFMLPIRIVGGWPEVLVDKESLKAND